MNFIEDVLQRFPFSQEAVITIDSEGRRKVHCFSHLFARSMGLSGAMLAHGVRRGDSVLLLIGSRIEWIISMLACFRMGAVAFPCNTQLTTDDLRFRAGLTNPKLAIGESPYLESLPEGIPYLDMDDLALIFDEDRSQKMPASSARLDPEDPAVITFTSGTTARPKGVIYPQRYLTGQILQAKNWFGAEPGEMAWCTASPGWSKSSRNSFIAPWLCDAKAFLVDERFDPERRLELLAQEEIAVLCQAPTEYRMIAKRADLGPLPHTRRLLSAGETLNPEVVEAFRSATDLEIADGYGQTETGAVTGFRPGDRVAGREGSMGRPLPGIETRIVDDELQIRPDSTPTFFSEYLDTGKGFDGEWWPTGDLVREDEDGFLYHLGRNDDVISSSGYRIGPVEVESVLIEHPAVIEVAVVAAPDSERGSVVRAVVVAAEGYGSGDLGAELIAFSRERTAPFKCPRIVDFVDELPKTDSGKIRREALRNQGE